MYAPNAIRFSRGGNAMFKRAVASKSSTSVTASDFRESRTVFGEVARHGRALFFVEGVNS